MKTVERWGNDRFVRMVNSQKPRSSVKLVNLRSQLMRRVVGQQRLVCILALCLLTPCSAVQSQGPIPETRELPGPSVEMIRRHVFDLADDSMMGRLVEQPGYDMAASYVASTLMRNGVLPAFLSQSSGDAQYFQDFAFTITGRRSEHRRLESYNVVGLVVGSDPALRPELVVVSAHLDHLGRRDRLIYNGASDNASGVAIVLETARLIAQHGSPRSVMFAFFGAEELGLHGSQHFVDVLMGVGANLTVNINVDDVGHLRVDAEGRPLLAVFAGHRICAETMDSVRTQAARLDVGITETDSQGLFERSDHYSFHRADIPTLFFCSGHRHRRLHSPDDDPEDIDYGELRRVAEIVFRAVVTVSNGSPVCNPVENPSN